MVRHQQTLLVLGLPPVSLHQLMVHRTYSGPVLTSTTHESQWPTSLLWSGEAMAGRSHECFPGVFVCVLI